MKDLVKVVGAEEQLVGYLGSNHGSEHCRVIAHVERGCFEGVQEVGTGSAERRASAQRRYLVRWAERGAQIEMLFFAYVVVQTPPTIEAGPYRRNGSRIVSRC